MRIFAIAIVFLGTALLFFLFVVAPYRCNRVKPAVERAIDEAADRQGSINAPVVARLALQRIENACACGLPDLDAQFDAAAALQLLSRNREAEQRYRAALALDRRPEIYLQLGNTQLALGQRAEGEQNLYRAGLFNPQMLEDVEDPLVRRRIYDRVVGARGHARLRTHR